MKFAEHLSAHITPEWRKQYIQYEYMKEMLYAALDSLPTAELLVSEQVYRDYVEQFDQQFFHFCEKELNKINTFFAEKLAEAIRKISDLKNELNNVLPGSSNDEHFHMQVLKANSNGNRSKKTKQSHKVAKKISDLKLAFSEFYLNLVLLQNYQTLNFTGFRKILKKHDKLLSTNSGNLWRQEKVDESRFYVCKEVDKLIDETENIFTNVLEDGNRSRAMKRLRVPPLNAHQSLWTTFRVGLFSGAFCILFLILILSLVHFRESTDTSMMMKLFRAPFLVCVFLFLIGVNVYGWRTSGVNHVLIFELDPRDHISEQHLFEISFMFFVIWSLSMLGFIYSPIMKLNPNLFPLVNVILFLIFLFNPTKTLNYSARYWLIRVLVRVFMAPLKNVTFADFWLADQLNSLNTIYSDAVYFTCFYITFYNSKPDGAVCLTSNTTFLVIRAICTAMPAWARFAQCLRRYYDDETRSLFPHIVNAGKYSTTFFVVTFSTLTTITTTVHHDPMSSPFFIPWIISLVVSSIYTYLWDIKMDWGLMDNTRNKDYCLLRDEIVYSSPNYYYFAYIEDFIGRTMWASTISLNHIGSIDGDLLTTVTSTVELVRRFIWNFFRLENEHLNNCGDFRAVRDISIAPININADQSNGQSKFPKAKKKSKSSIHRSIPYSINNHNSQKSL